MAHGPRSNAIALGGRSRRPRGRGRDGSLAVVAAGLVIGTVAGLAWTPAGWSPGLPAAAGADPAPGTFACTVTSITDGDTFRCAETDGDGRDIRIRLSGVAARERDGSCSRGHPCPSASAEAATAELRRLAQGERLACRDVGSTYGRTAAFCARDDGLDLSCAMVESGTAVRWERYWDGHRCA